MIRSINKMMEYCKRCKTEIRIPEFSEEQRLEIWSMKALGMSLFAIKQIKDKSDLDLKESKVLLNHINTRYGDCIRCNNSKLEKENIECPKCKSFNLNWKINQSFNEEFCLALEYKLCQAFENSKEMELRRFGCDGIEYIPEDIKDTSIGNAVKRKMIKTEAKLGYSGQVKYEAIIKLGKKSLKNYSEKLSIIEFIPKRDLNDWIKLDRENKIIEIKLE